MTIPEGWREETWLITLRHLNPKCPKPGLDFLERAAERGFVEHCGVLEGSLSGEWPDYEIQRLQQRRYGTRFLKMMDDITIEAKQRGFAFSPDFQQKLERLRDLVSRVHRSTGSASSDGSVPSR
jgi:hypothetical protein